MAENKSSSKKEEALNSLPKNLHPIFKQIIAEYRYHCIERYGSPFVSYIVLADLIRGGWRPTHKPFVEF